MEQGIRAHHLDFLLELDRAHLMYEQNGYSPYESRSLAENQAREWMVRLLSTISQSATQDPSNRDRYLDIVGTDPRLMHTIARSFASAIIGIYREVNSQICIHGGLDTMCNACAVGEHCHEDTYDFERQYMLDIMRVADRLDLPYEVTEDGSLNIQSGNLKQVLRSMNKEEVAFTYSNELLI